MLQIPKPYEPKRKNRFLVKLPEIMDIEQYLLSSMSRPSFKVNRDNLVDMYSWDEMKLTFYDPISPSMTQKLWDLIVLFNEDDVRYKMLGDEFKLMKNGFTFIIQLLGPIGDVVEEWEIFGKISGVNFGGLSMESDNLALCSMMIQPITVKLNY